MSGGVYKTLKSTYNYVENTLKKKRDFMKKSYDKRSHIIPFQEGQYVYLWRPRPPNNKNKFFDNFFGPFKILKKVTDFTYKIDIGHKSRLHPIVPHDLLKLAKNYDPESMKTREYDPIDLDLDHELKIVPIQNSTDTIEDVQRNDPPQRQLITQSRAGRNLRNRRNIRRPDFYQAG